MPSLAKEDLERMLRSKFHFEPDERDHTFWVLRCGGRIVVRTKTSRGSAKYKQLGDSLIGSMAKQLHLTSGQLRAAVRGAFSFAEYVHHLEKSGYIVAGACAEYL